MRPFFGFAFNLFSLIGVMGYEYISGKLGVRQLSWLKHQGSRFEPPMGHCGAIKGIEFNV